MKATGTIIVRCLAVGLAAVLGGLLSLIVAAVILATLGVWLQDHQDYFSPFYHDAGTPVSEYIGGAIFYVAGILGFMVPLIIGLRWVKPRFTRQGTA